MMPGLVVFGEDWGRHPSSTQHLVRKLAADYSVVWVNSIGMRRPRFNLRDIKRAADKLLRCVRPSATAKAPSGGSGHRPMNLSVLSPVTIPWPGSSMAFAVNRNLLSRHVKRHLDGRSMSHPILWTSLPTALPAVGHIGERAVVYYCGDDFGALAGVDHAPVVEMELALVEKADLVIAASSTLAQRFPAHKTLLLPHGADVALFSQSSSRAKDLPAGLVAGFYGSIAGWVDVELLAGAAKQLSHWHFVFVGNVETDVSELAKLPNVIFLGPRPHHELPSYSQHWQISLLPFRDCPQIRACNPLKLLEYMAAGSEIVGTDFPALAPYRDFVSVAGDIDVFVAAIEASTTSPDRTAERRKRVATETWDARAQLLARALSNL